MTLNTNRFALAAAVTMGILYIVCAAFTALAPELALRFLGWMVHLVNLEQATEVQITFTGFIFGLLPILFYAYIGAWLFAWLYNRFLQPQP